MATAQKRKRDDGGMGGGGGKTRVGGTRGKSGDAYNNGREEDAISAILISSITPFIADMLSNFFDASEVPDFIEPTDGGIVGVIPPQSRDKTGNYNPRLLIVEEENKALRTETTDIKIQTGATDITGVTEGNRIMVVWVPDDAAVTHVGGSVTGIKVAGEGEFVTISHAGIVAWFAAMEPDDFHKMRWDTEPHCEGAMALVGELAEASLKAPISGERYINNLAAIDNLIHETRREDRDDDDDDDDDEEEATARHTERWNIIESRDGEAPTGHIRQGGGGDRDLDYEPSDGPDSGEESDGDDDE